MNRPGAEKRRSARRSVGDVLQVTNAMTGVVMGRIGKHEQSVEIHIICSMITVEKGMKGKATASKNRWLHTWSDKDKINLFGTSDM